MRNFVNIYNHLENICQHVKFEDTGNATELAKKIGISKRSLFNYFKILQELGINIKYSYSNYTYQSINDFENKKTLMQNDKLIA